MPEMIIYRGPQATGKSTAALELVEQGWVRINMDSIRATNPDWKEKQVHAECWRLMEAAAIEGANIVHDNVNLSIPKVQGLQNWAQYFGYRSTVQLFGTDVSLGLAVSRDIWRGYNGGHSVGRSVIIQSYMDFSLFIPFNPDAVDKTIIFDLDGTLCDCEHRQHYVRGDTKDWGAFFAGISRDTPRTAVANLVRMYDELGYTVLFVSGRGSEYRKETEAWLKAHLLNRQFALFMRGFQDRRDDTIVKQELYEKYIKPYFNVEAVYDDRPKVVRMWREIGLTVFDCGNGVEF